MSDDEVDELLKAVDTSSAEINYTGELLSHPRFVTITTKQTPLSLDLVRTILAN